MATLVLKEVRHLKQQKSKGEDPGHLDQLLQSQAAVEEALVDDLDVEAAKKILQQAGQVLKMCKKAQA